MSVFHLIRLHVVNVNQIPFRIRVVHVNGAYVVQTTCTNVRTYISTLV